MKSDKRQPRNVCKMKITSKHKSNLKYFQKKNRILITDKYAVQEKLDKI